VTFLNWRFGLTQITAWRIEVAPIPDLSNVASPTKAIITIPITLYGYGNGDNAEEGGSKGSAMSREYGEHKCDKVRRCSRLVWPLGDRKRDMLQLHPAAVRFSHHAHRILVQPVQAGLLLQKPWR
jgi:hypothetical protein